MKKKKLLHVVEAFGGGVFTFLADLSNTLCDRYEVVIAYTVRPQTPERFESYFDSRVRFIPLTHFKRSIGPHDVKALRELRALIQKEQPDLVHLHSSKAGFIGRFSVNGRRTPVFYNPHGYSFLIRNVSLAKRAAYRVVEKIGGLRRCTTVCVSKSEGEAARSVTRAVSVINNGVSPRSLDAYVREPGNLRVVAACGRICPQKAPDVFNEIALLLPDFSFVWIGDGEQRELLTAPNIRITGWLEREEALKELSACGTFVLPSLWEGLPISLLEAMYLKKFCVASGCIGNRDVIVHGENGMVAHIAAEYAGYIRSAAEGAIPAGLMAEQAHRDVEENYNTQRMAEQYHALYQRALGRKEGTEA